MFPVEQKGQPPPPAPQQLVSRGRLPLNQRGPLAARAHRPSGHAFVCQGDALPVCHRSPSFNMQQQGGGEGVVNFLQSARGLD